MHSFHLVLCQEYFISVNSIDKLVTLVFQEESKHEYYIRHQSW